MAARGSSIISNIMLMSLAVYLISVPLFSELPVGASVSRGLGVVAAAVFVFCTLLRGGTVRVPTELVLLGLFIIYTFAGAFVAVDMAAFLSRQFTLIQLWFLLVMMYNVFCIDRASVTRLLRILLASILAAGLIGLLHWEPSSGRLGGTLVNPNAFGTTMLLGLALTLLYPGQRGFIHRVPAGIIVIGLALAVLLSGSRKAILGAIGLLVVYGVLLAFRSVKRPVRFFGLIAILVIGAVVGFEWLQETPYWTRVENFFRFLQGQTVEEGSLYERADLIAAGIHLWKEHPLIGVGTDQFRFYAGGLGLRETYSHSNPVEILANFGLIGLFLYYSPYIALSWRLLSAMFSFWPFRQARYWFLFLAAFWTIWVGSELAWVSYYSKVHWIAFGTVLVLASHFGRFGREVAH